MQGKARFFSVLVITVFVFLSSLHTVFSRRIPKKEESKPHSFVQHTNNRKKIIGSDPYKFSRYLETSSHMGRVRVGAVKTVTTQGTSKGGSKGGSKNKKKGGSKNKKRGGSKGGVITSKRGAGSQFSRPTPGPDCSHLIAKNKQVCNGKGKCVKGTQPSYNPTQLQRTSLLDIGEAGSVHVFAGRNSVGFRARKGGSSASSASANKKASASKGGSSASSSSADKKASAADAKSSAAADKKASDSEKKSAEKAGAVAKKSGESTKKSTTKTGAADKAGSLVTAGLSAAKGGSKGGSSGGSSSAPTGAGDGKCQCENGWGGPKCDFDLSNKQKACSPMDVSCALPPQPRPLPPCMGPAEDYSLDDECADPRRRRVPYPPKSPKPMKKDMFAEPEYPLANDEEGDEWWREKARKKPDGVSETA